tara:strand:- start:128 stop:355 length:228 start_codon:yes stop_codon:yes gene_type:complete
MASSLLKYDLTPDNVDDAKLSGKVDLEDTLRRVAREWLATRKKCECGSNTACSICEIDYLLEEAFELPESVFVNK